MSINKEKCQAYHDMLLAMVRELSDDEYRTHLEKQKEDIVKAVLDLCTTKQKNLYRTGSVAEAVAKSFAVNRISDKRRLDTQPHWESLGNM